MEVYGGDLTRKWGSISFEIPGRMGSSREMGQVSVASVCMEEWFRVYVIADTMYINLKMYLFDFP